MSSYFPPSICLVWDTYAWSLLFIQGAYQFSKMNLRPFLRRFKTDLSGI